MMLPVPYTFDSSGVEGQQEPRDTNGSYTLTQDGSRWMLTVHMDRDWMNDPSLVYPLTVDPTVMPSYFNDARSVKSDGTVVMGSPVRFGNPNEPGGAKWRGLVHWDYSKYFNKGYQLVNAEVELARAGGTANAYGASMWTANGYGFANAGTNLAYAPWFGDSADLIGSPLINQMRGDFNTSNGGPYYMFVGDETNGAYTYKQAAAVLWLTLNQPASIATQQAPSNGATNHTIEPVLKASAIDPESDPVYYYFRVSTNPNPDAGGVVWQSGWTDQSSVQVPANTLTGGTKYYWKVFTKDYCHLDQNFCGYGGTSYTPSSWVWSFTTNAPPVSMSGTGATPGPGTVATTTPTLSVPATTDPDSTSLKYWFSVSTGAGGETGTIVASGWLNGTSWTVPSGYLQNGVTYYWTAWATDGISRDQGVWSNKLQIDQRIGDPKTSPTDSVGAATVNLANGNLVFSTGSPTAAFAKSEVGLTFTYNSQAVAAPAGLRATYYEDVNKNKILDSGTDKQLLQRIEPQISGNWTGTSPFPGVVPNEWFIGVWDGKITAPSSGQYLIGVQHDDGVTAHVNGTKVYESTGVTYGPTWQADKPVTLTGGQAVPINITYQQGVWQAFLAVSIKRADGAPLYSGGPTEARIPASWLSTTDRPALPDGWTLSTDIDGDAAYTRAAVATESITIYDGAATPHVYSKTTNNGQIAWKAPDGEHGVLSVAGNGEITLLDEDGSRATFTSGGQIKDYQLADATRSGTALQYTYSGDPARLARVTDPVSGMYVAMQYGRAGDACYSGITVPTGLASSAPADMLCKITYPDGTSSLLFYHPNGQLARMLDPGAETTDFGYNGTGKLSQVRDPLAFDTVAAGYATNDDTASSTISYDSNGRVSHVQSPKPSASQPRLGHTYTYQAAPVRDSNGGTASDGITLVHVDGLTPASGFDTKVTFNADYRATSTSDALGRTSYTEYNGNDQLLKSTDPAGRVSTTTYDYADRPTAEYGPAPVSCFTGYTPTPACAATVPTSSTAYDEGLQGLHTEWWNNATYSGAPAARTLGLGTSANGATAANWGTGAPVSGINADNFSMRATGYITFANAGNYQFALSGDDEVNVWINNELLGKATYSSSTTFYYPATAGSTVPIKIEQTEGNSTAYLNLTWQPPGTTGYQTIPLSVTNPAYGLATTTTTQDSGGATPTETTTNNYGDKPWEGLIASSTQDPGGLALASSFAYDTLKRRLTRTLPSGSTYTDAYYGNTETRTNPCVPGSPAINQAGRLKANTSPVNGNDYALAREYVYDASGRVLAQRIAADGDSGWTCTIFDARGRTTQVTHPATVDDLGTAGLDESTPARTVTYNHAGTGDPRITTVSDLAGVITTVTDLSGKVTSYTDANGVITTTSYDAAGRTTGETTTTGGVPSVTGFTYNDAGQVVDTQLDGATVSTATLDPTTGELTAAGYGNTSTAAITRDGSGRLATLQWGLNGTILTSTVTRAQSGRITTDGATDTANAASGYAWVYTYDAVGRLSAADLAAQGARPAVSLQYGFDTSAAAPGCAPGAGKNSNRAAVTGTIGGTTQTPVTSCYDTADRALHDSTGVAYSYDKHGNTTKVTNTTNGDVTMFVYDSDDRHIKTITPNGSGATATITYTRDATGRIIARIATGSSDPAENGEVTYGFTASGDTPDIYLNTNGAISQRVLGLDGGASLAKDYGDPSKTKWAYPNIHGDNIAISTGSAGHADDPIVCYDPYGTPINATGSTDAEGAPDTSPGAFDAGWLGQHLRYTEHTAALNYIQMGQRLYDPTTGRFLQVDPIEGGSANDYDYVNADPTNAIDLDGTRPVKLKKGQKLSCGKGRYSYATYIGGQKYWDCASKAATKKKQQLWGKTKTYVAAAAGFAGQYLARVACRVSLVCAFGWGAASGIASYRIQNGRKATFWGTVGAGFGGGIGGLIGFKSPKGKHHK